ncbi:MAG: thioredoxin family protein [Alistipes sp.]|nr:thioredoxin family protein [Candidatus Minthomonas equi]
MIVYKNILTVLSSLLVCINAAAAHVEWKVSVKNMDEGLWEITATASIEKTWHIYDLGPYENGPLPTSMKFELPEGVTVEGDIVPSKKSHRAYDATFGMEIGWWEDEISLSGRLRCDHPGTTVTVHTEWMACDAESCSPPDEWETVITLSDKISPVESGTVQSTDTDKNNGLLALIIEAILWGLAAILTPCVFPIIPMTVSFFLKGDYTASRNKFRALSYGFFIIILYTVPIAIIILATKFIGGDAITADIFNWLATHWIPNVLFFLVFMVFAASFFGAFEIVLPSSIQNGSDAQVDKRKGLGSIFFLALTLVLVSFSCTGPIVGTVIIKSTSGEFWTPIVTMFAFSVAFSLPFVICALFPTLMKRLPKSGSWLNTVKVTLGFIEIALGFKFLSTADQVYHWGLLDREIYLAIWITVFTLLGFYLLGKLKFKNDSDIRYVSLGRLTLAIIDFTFVIYMIPGMWGAPLKALSGYLPPMETQDFIIGVSNTATTINSSPAPENSTLPGKGKYSAFLKLPLGLQGFFDLDEARSYAAMTGKQIFIDFTGHGCVNCREMESRVWSAPEVLKRLSENFVICALYTDDKATVPEADWITTPNGKVLKTIGRINAWYAEQKFGVAAQPFYVITDSDGTVLRTRSYDLNVGEFVKWLDGR